MRGRVLIPACAGLIVYLLTTGVPVVLLAFGAPAAAGGRVGGRVDWPLVGVAGFVMSVAGLAAIVVWRWRTRAVPGGRVARGRVPGAHRADARRRG
jgi:hypothetical protein